MTTSNQFPIGAVVAFAGTLTSNSEKQGWYLCDGTSMRRPTDSTGTLFGAIGAYYGATSSDTFNLPDYRGMFLRGVDDGSGHDPDAAYRGAPCRGLADNGNHSGVGSVQGSAVGPHTHTASHKTGSIKTQYQDGSGHSAVGQDTINMGMNPAGITETRPINQAVEYAIKSDDVSNGAELLTGTVVAFAGDLSTPNASLAGAGWLPCDGASYTSDPNGAYGALAGVVEVSYGSSYASSFCVPRYSGMFLRGLDTGAGRDPDVTDRGPPRPNLSQHGASGAQVGSVQNQNFVSHAHTFTTMGNVQVDTQWVCNMNYPAAGSTNVSSGWSGGLETRPCNVALEYVIANAGATAVPGLVIAFAGDVVDPAVASDLATLGWLVCDGASYPTSGSTGALYQAIGNAHGGDSQHFNVPDLRGRFVRAVDHGNGTDDDPVLDHGPRRAAAAGGNTSAVGSYEDADLQSHTHSYGKPSTTLKVTGEYTSKDCSDTTETTVTSGNPTGENNNQYPPSGVSSETRPMNQAVYFLIKS